MAFEYTIQELIDLPELYQERDLCFLINTFFDESLGHLNFKGGLQALQISGIYLSVKTIRKTLEVSLPYSSSYRYYDIWEIAVLYYLGQPIIGIDYRAITVDKGGPYLYQMSTDEMYRILLYTISQKLEVVMDGFNYGVDKPVLNYREPLPLSYLKPATP